MPEEVKDEQGKDVTTPLDESDKDKQPKTDDPLHKLSNEIFARIGRLDAEHRKDREAILTRLDRLSEARKPEIQSNSSGDSGMKDLNDKWSERILQGDVAGVLEEYTSLRKSAEDTLSKRTIVALDKSLSDLEEQNVKYIKDIKDSVRKTASILVGQNYSPQDAVAFAYEKARADHLDRLVGSAGEQGFDTSSLETSTGGSKHEDAGSRRGKLNADGKKAWEKNKSYFKNEAEFIASMAPRVKERFVG